MAVCVRMDYSPWHENLGSGRVFFFGVLRAGFVKPVAPAEACPVGADDDAALCYGLFCVRLPAGTSAPILM